MGFWELATIRHVESPAVHLDKLAALISEGKTGFEAARAVFAADFAVAPTESLSLLSATGLLIEALLETSSQTDSG